MQYLKVILSAIAFGVVSVSVVADDKPTTQTIATQQNAGQRTDPCRGLSPEACGRVERFNNENKCEPNQTILRQPFNEEFVVLAAPEPMAKFQLAHIGLITSKMAAAIGQAGFSKAQTYQQLASVYEKHGCNESVASDLVDKNYESKDLPVSAALDRNNYSVCDMKDRIHLTPDCEKIQRHWNDIVTGKYTTRDHCEALAHFAGSKPEYQIEVASTIMVGLAILGVGLQGYEIYDNSKQQERDQLNRELEQAQRKLLSAQLDQQQAYQELRDHQNKHFVDQDGDGVLTYDEVPGAVQVESIGKEIEYEKAKKEVERLKAEVDKIEEKIGPRLPDDADEEYKIDQCYEENTLGNDTRFLDHQREVEQLAKTCSGVVVDTSRVSVLETTVVSEARYNAAKAEWHAKAGASPKQRTARSKPPYNEAPGTTTPSTHSVVKTKKRCDVTALHRDLLAFDDILKDEEKSLEFVRKGLIQQKKRKEKIFQLSCAPCEEGYRCVYDYDAGTANCTKLSDVLPNFGAEPSTAPPNATFGELPKANLSGYEHLGNKQKTPYPITRGGTPITPPEWPGQ